MKPLPLNDPIIKRRGVRPAERRIVVLVMEDRNGKPHIQCFGESISLTAPAPAMIEMFRSLLHQHGATFEVNGKEWKPDGEDSQTN